MFRFSIRDVLWLMLTVGIAMGWWLNTRSLQAPITRLHSESLELQLELQDSKERLRGAQISHVSELRRLHVRLATETDRRLEAERLLRERAEKKSFMTCVFASAH
jgi:hypothetical protein